MKSSLSVRVTMDSLNHSNNVGQLEVFGVPLADFKANSELRRSLLAATSTTAVQSLANLKVQCLDGTFFDITHEEALMSTRLWMLRQEIIKRNGRSSVSKQSQLALPILDVPSSIVELALFYCRCVYRHQIEGNDHSMQEWEERYTQLDSKRLCDLAKVASNLDIQGLIDITCRSIAQIMSSTEAAHDLRQKFGLDEVECSCELRNGMSSLDFDLFNALDHDLSTDEYEFVEFDQPSVDELVNFINSDGKTSRLRPSAGKKCQVHEENGQETVSSSNKRKKKKKKSKKKGSKGNEEEEEESRAEAFKEKMRLACQNPNAVFQESQFEDDPDEEVQQQLESFRHALESAHLSSTPAKMKPRLQFTPQDVFRSSATVV